MQSIILTLNHFHAYLDGGSTDDLREYMKKYDRYLDDLDRDFHLVHLGNDEILEPIDEILRSLGIPEVDWPKFRNKNTTAYAFLCNLAKADYLQAANFIDMIDGKKLVRKTMIGLGIFYPVTLAAVLTTAPFFPEILEFVTHFLESEMSLPVIGMVQTSATLAYNIYQMFADHKQSWFNRLRDGGFSLAKAGVNYTGYGLLMTGAISLSWALAGMLVFSTLVDVAQEVFCLIQEVIHYWRSPITVGDDPLILERAKLRHHYAFEQHRNAAFINLVSVILMAGLTAILTFVPGLQFVILAGIGLGLVYGANYLLLRKNEHVMRDRLQVALVNVGESYKAPEVELESVTVLKEPDEDFGIDESLAPKKSSEQGFVGSRLQKIPSAAELPFFNGERLKAEEVVPSPAMSPSP